MSRISDYADILIMAPCHLGYLWTADKFCKKFLVASKGRELFFVLFSFCGWLFWNIAVPLYTIPYIFCVAVYSIFFVGLVLFCFKAEWEKRILAAVMLLMAVMMSADFVVSFLSCMVLFFRRTVGGIPEPLVGDLEGGMIGGVGYCSAIVLVCWMSRHLETVFSGKRRKWYCLLAVPMLILIAVFGIVGWGESNGIMVRSGGNMGLYYDQIFSYIGNCVLKGLSFFAIGFYVFGMNRIYLEQEKSCQYHFQIAVYKMLAEQYRQSERLRHDMKNHIIALAGLFHGREWEKMGDYLKQLEENGLEDDGDMTGSKAVDALLYQNRKQAKKEGVRWECDINMSKVCCINEFDLCVLFGNILDNALEACGRIGSEECRFINISAKTVKKCFLLEVKNSMDRREKYTDGFTNKVDSQEHGIGLLNVGDVVNRYNGAVHIEAEEGIFVISVLIPLNDAAHDIKTAL